MRLVVLHKAARLPVGAVRMYKNGEAFRKVGGPKGWEYIGKNGGARAQAAIEAAKKAGLPIIQPTIAPKAAAPDRKADAAKSSGGPGGAIKRWLERDPDKFKAALGHAINVAHPHPMFQTGDVKGKLPEGNEQLVQLAMKYKMEAPKDAGIQLILDQVPENWSKLDYADRLRNNRELFVQQIVQARAKNFYNRDIDPEKDYQIYKEIKAGHKLLQVAKNYLPADKAAAAKEIVAVRGKEKKRKDDPKVVDEVVSIVKASPHTMPVEKILAEATVKSAAAHKGGVNKVYVVELEDKDGSKRKGIFKPIAGEYEEDLRDSNIPIGQQWKRERLASVFDNILGLGIVPPVVLREVNGEMGVVMDFVPGDVFRHSYARYDDADVEEWQKLALFDWLTGNTDRHGGNYIIDKNNGKLWAIDNGLAFPERVNFAPCAGLRSEPMLYVDEKRDRDLANNAVGAVLTPENKKKCMDAMKKFNIGGKGVELFEKRWDYIAKHKKLPEYGNGQGLFFYPKERELEEIAK